MNKSEEHAITFCDLYVPVTERARALLALHQLLELARQEGERKGLEFAHGEIEKMRSP